MADSLRRVDATQQSTTTDEFAPAAACEISDRRIVPGESACEASDRQVIPSDTVACEISDRWLSCSDSAAQHSLYKASFTDTANLMNIEFDPDWRERLIATFAQSSPERLAKERRAEQSLAQQKLAEARSSFYSSKAKRERIFGDLRSHADSESREKEAPRRVRKNWTDSGERLMTDTHSWNEAIHGQAQHDVKT